MRAHIALPFLAALSFAAAALADPSDGTIMKVAPPDEQKPPSPAQICEHQFEIQAAQAGMLETALKLSPAQKPVFNAWRKIRLELWRSIPCPPLPMGLGTPVPKRLENQITMLSANLAGLRKELPPSDALYKVLTPEQRVLFDGPTKMAMPAASH